MGASRIKKTDDELRIVWGEVYVPGFPDSHGEFMTATEVRKMAHRFAMVEKLGQVDVMHDNKVYRAHVVESFIARKGDPDFIEGAWVAGVYIEDTELWERVKKGELNGFSLEGMAMLETESSEIDLDVPAVVMCETLKSDSDHTHQVKLMFDEEGNIVGGETDYVNGHRHLVKRGTVTEMGGDPEHCHKFSFLEAVLGA